MAIEKHFARSRGKLNVTYKDLKEVKQFCPELADKFAEYTEQPDHRLLYPKATWNLYMKFP